MSHNWYIGNDLTLPMFQRVLSLYAKYPYLKSRYETLLGPFNFSVWMALLTMIISTSITLVLSSKCLVKSNNSLFDSTVPSYSVLISESMPYHIMYKSMSTSKWTLLSFLIPLSAFLCHAYRSNLLASLIEHEHEKPVDTYQDIIDRDITIYLANGTTVLPLMANSPNPTVVQTYWNNLIGKDGIYNKENGKAPDRVWNALYSGKGVILYPKEKEKLYIRRGRSLILGNFMCGYYLTMGHPINPMLVKTIQHLVENGIYQKLVDHFVWIRKADLRQVIRNKALQEEKWTKLQNGHIMPVYLMSAVLIAFSCLVFIGDLYIMALKEKAQ